LTTLPAKPARASHTVTTQLVFPEHANALGKAFGGQVMAWADMCGGICSMRHSGGPTVTAAIDDLVFERPINIGDTVVIEARVNAAFRSSMEVEVEVWGEAPATGQRWRCVQSRFTFVGIDGEGKLRDIPGLLVESDDDQLRVAEASARRAERLARRKR
jgi:acyl-CoA hydrolase